MRKWIFLCLVLIVCAAAVGLSIRRRADWNDSQNVVFCATTYPVWLFAREAMRGTSLKLELLVPSSSGCPHDYVATPSDLAKISTGRIVLLTNGAGLDDSVRRAAETVRPDLAAVDASQGLVPMESAAEDVEESGNHGHRHSHAMNGHFFASPKQAGIMVENIAKAVLPYANTPEEADRIRRNVSEFHARLDALAEEFRTKLAFGKDVPTAAQHNVFDYLFRDSGLQPPLPLTANPEAPLSPGELTRLKRLFQEKKIRAVFTEPQYPEKIAKLLASESGVSRVVSLDPCASGPEDPPYGYYEAVMRKNLETLQEALQ